MITSVISGIIGLIVFFCSGQAGHSQNTEYKATPVTISKETVRDNGKLFYSHVVLERQTLFSISKAYNVSIQEIFDANPALNLEKEGLKTYQILMIPVKEETGAKPGQEPVQESAAPQIQERTTPQIKVDDIHTLAGTPEKYAVHTVKWFEDLDSISKKYGVSKEAIMKANGMKSASVSRKQKLKIPLDGQSSDNETVAEENKGIFETIGESISEKVEDLYYAGKNDVTAALILPFNAQKQPNDNNLDFYSGVLLAAHDLSKKGINLNLNVYDAAGGTVPVSREQLNECDFVLGPISTNDISSTLKICPSSTPVISPLEPKAADLAALHNNLIQAPSPSGRQCSDLIEWLKEEYSAGDKVILFTEKGKARTSAADELLNALVNSGLTYSTISYGLLEGKDIAGAIEKAASMEHTTRIVIASESEAFVNDVVRNANLIVHRKYDLALYCTSKVRSFETIEIENLHNTHMHTSISYYVDYEKPEVQKFLMAYRALFNTEPGPFAFQGYDTAYFFSNLSSDFGSHWADKLDGSSWNGLQSDFLFQRIGNGGYINTAVKRILYDRDFKIRQSSGK